MKLTKVNSRRLRELKPPVRLPMNRIVNDILEKYFNHQLKEERTMINTVTIVGNLGQDPEIRYTASGIPVASFTVAVNLSPNNFYVIFRVSAGI